MDCIPKFKKKIVEKLVVVQQGDFSNDSIIQLMKIKFKHGHI